MSEVQDSDKVYRSKWYLIYFFLAGFDLLTILLSLLLNHSLVTIHQRTVSENRAWADRLTLIFGMSEAASQMNVAANDVFATNDVSAAGDLVNRFADRFDGQLAELESNVRRDVRARGDNFVRHLHDAREAMQAQIEQANEMFVLYDRGDHTTASRAMAQMDRQNARIVRALANVRQEAEAIQDEYFQQQTAWATRLRTMEYVLFVFVALMVLAATLYGTKLARTASAAFRIIEDQRLEQTHRAQRMSEVAQLATGVAHELRNPLTSVKLLVQAGQRDGLDEEDLAIVAAEVGRMERTLQSFLDYARPAQPKIRECDLGMIVRRTEQLLQIRADQQHVALQTSGPESLKINADEDQILQLLLNLGQNALDAMPGGGTLQIHYDQRVSTVQLHVRDTGGGISEDLRNRLFQPFVSGKETGVGLGLVISQQIARQHGGELRLADNGMKQQGARFTLRLPLSLTDECAP